MELSIDYLDKLFHHCRARVLVFSNCVEITRSAGDGLAFVHLVQHLRGEEVTAPQTPLAWRDQDVGHILETLSEAPGEAPSLIDKT